MAIAAIIFGMFKSLSPDSTLARAHLLMQHQRTQSLAVYDQGKLVGTICDEDIQRAIQNPSEKARIVGNYMRKERFSWFHRLLGMR